jgi:tetratricopeptide (TPR) repeat protein
MTVDEILAKLNSPDVAADRLLDATRASDPGVWVRHPELYLAFAERLLNKGHYARVLDLAREDAPHRPDGSRLKYLFALAAARGGAARYAEGLLKPLLDKATGPDRPADMDDALRVDVVSLQGRVLKDRSEREPGRAAEAARWYERAAELAGTADPTFPLINAATMWRIVGDKPKSDALAARVIALVGDRADAAADAGDLWPAATLGEAYLLLGRHEDALRWYLRAVAVAGDNVGQISSMLNNVRRLHAVKATADPEFLNKHLGRVVVFSGHLLDSPDRLAAGAAPRFPNHPPLVEAAARAIRERLDALNAKVGLCSLGCGGDILFAEAMLDRGAELHVVLPFDESDFLRTSVNFGQSGPGWRGWVQRFHAILGPVEAAGRLRYLTREPYLGSADLFAMTNRVLQGLAVLHARERASVPTALALIDRAGGGDAGGTADFLTSWAATGYAAEEIDLGALRAAHPAPPAAPAAAAQPPATGALPRLVKCVLFADVAGYSGIKEWQLPAFWAAYGRFLRTLFESGPGAAAVYANTWGDGIYAVFDRAEGAASFAVELTEPSPGLPVPDWGAFGLGPASPLRVALHAGPVFEVRDVFQPRSGFTGQHVNRGARIEPITVPGCAYASEPFAALLVRESGGRFAVETVGTHSLAKDYDRCPLYRVHRAAGT